MKIELKEIPVREIFEGYLNTEEGGVFGYDGKLNIRPRYQREFVYKDQKRDMVIDSIRKGFPLNLMYWSKNEDGTYEVLDGQQRTLSIMQYLNGEYSIDHQFRHNLTQEELDQILDYKLMIYICEGTEREKLDWFRVINIAGEKLTDQELRNASYTGTWLESAKSIFSKTGAPAGDLADKYLNGSSIRQDYLETAIRWVSDDHIEDYMATHQHDPNANEMWTYFRNVVEWVKMIFPEYRKEMKGLDWGTLFKNHGKEMLDANELEDQIKALMSDDDIKNKKGIYEYVLSKNTKSLNIRTFTDAQKRTMFERQNGECPICHGVFEFSEMEGDHITPWTEGGKTELSNGQMLCKECNRRKSSK